MRCKRRILLAALTALSVPLAAQRMLTLESALAEARANNLQMQAATIGIEEAEHLKRTAGEIPKTDVLLTHGQYNSYISSDNNITLSQSLPFPTVWTTQKALGKANVQAAGLMRQRVENEVTYRVSGLFYQLLYLDARHQLILRQDTLYGQLVRAATLRYNTGEGTLLDKLSAETQWNEIRNQLRQNEGNKQILIAQLAALLNTGDSLILVGRFEELLATSDVLTDQNPGLQYMQQQTDVALRQQRVQAARFLPDITVGYFNQSLIGFQNVNGQEQYFDAGERFQGFQIGLSLPLWFVPNSARLKAASLQTEKARKEYESYQTMLTAELTSALRENEKAAQSLSYYTQSALPNARQLVRQSNVAFLNGEIDYTAHLLNLRNGLGIEESHLASLNDYQQSVLKINYLTGSLTGTK